VGWRHENAFAGNLKHIRSKPTVWDGDFRRRMGKHLIEACSKPTVWDGDRKIEPPDKLELECSKPTVWDEDQTV
jgi:hypothetical protein